MISEFYDFFQLVPSENCHTHGMPLALWCHTCCAAICRACATQSEHPGHQVKSQAEAKEQLVSEVSLKEDKMYIYLLSL